MFHDISNRICSTIWRTIFSSHLFLTCCRSISNKSPNATRPYAPLMDEDEDTDCRPGFAFSAVDDHAHSQQFSYTTRLAPLWNGSPGTWFEYQRHNKLFKMQAEHLTRDEPQQHVTAPMLAARIAGGAAKDWVVHSAD